jgi:hypothetical protein
MGIRKNRKDYFFRKPDSIFYRFLYSNNEIWEYTINKDSGELTAFYIGKRR